MSIDERPIAGNVAVADPDDGLAPELDSAVGPEPATGPQQPPSGWDALKRTLRDARDFKAMAASPYGLAPALTFGGVAFVQNFDTAAFSVAAPEIARDLEINVGDIISIQVMVATIAIFAGIGAGYLADRVRRTPFYVIGTILSGLFSLIGSRATSFFTIAYPRVADDVSEKAADVPAFSLLADYYPIETRGKAFALLGTMSRLGRIFVPVTLGIVVTEYGWQWAFVATGVPLTLAGVVSGFTLLRREPIRGYFERKALGADEETANVEDEPLSFGESWRATWGVRTIRRAVIANTIGAMGEAVASLFFVFWLAEIYGLSAFERGLAATPGIFAALAGGFIGGGLVDRFTASNPGRVLSVIGTFTLISGLGPLVYVFEPPLWIVVGAFLPLSFGGAMIGPASSVVFANVIPPSIRTMGIQLTAVSTLGATLIGLPIGRIIFGLYGYTEVFIFATIPAAIGGIVWFTVAPFYELDIRSAQLAAVADSEWKKAKALGNSKLLVARGVDVAYSGVQVLFDVDLDVTEGEIVALLGTNGAGKSTLLKAISGVTQATGGSVVFDGRDITYMPPHEIVARGVVHMPGGRGVFPELSVRENLLLANWLEDDPEVIKAGLAEVMEIFPRLRERLDTAAGQLSGGEQQQVALAQAFLSKPHLLCIDELSLGLSPVAVAELLEVVRELNRRGITIVVVEQSINVALTIASRCVFMEKGEIKFEGPTTELLERPDILRAVYVKGTGGGAGGAGSADRAKEQARLLELGEARSVLEVDGLTKRYGGVTAVNDVSFDLRDGEVLGLIGPNGAGKTTIFDLISGFQPLDSGVVRLDGIDITDLSSHERARMGLVRRFQDARLFPALTVQETLLMALEDHLEVKNTILNGFGVRNARRAERKLRARADRLLELFELGAFRDKFVKELSTGLRRIVDLACVLATEPTVLLLDEPSSGVAQAETEALGPLLRRIRYETGASILIIEHDMPLISRVSDELIALELGTVVTRGTPDEVLNDPRVIESYLGTDEATVSRSGAEGADRSRKLVAQRTATTESTGADE